MENKKLLNRYKIKLSLFFAVFVMLCFYLIQGIFLTIQYFENKNDLENFLLKKLIWVENIIKNKENYYSQIENENNNDYTIKISDENKAHELLKRLIENEVIVNKFEIMKPTLNDIFIEKVGE